MNMKSLKALLTPHEMSFIFQYWEKLMLKLFDGIEQSAATEPCRNHEASCDVADVQHHGRFPKVVVNMPNQLCGCVC
jgi:hypothetical protein